MLKLCAVIPALNEERRIAAVITEVRRQGIDVLVVDDGSRDATGAVASSAGAAVIRHETNRGKGAALRTGFIRILDKGYEAVITLDGDGQHDPAEIPLFIAEAAGTGADIVSGSRMGSLAGMPPQRILCNRVGSSIVSRLCREEIPDALIGYRLIKTAVLRAIRLEADRYEIDPEILIRSSRAGFRIAHIGVSCIYDGQRSRIRPLCDGILFFRLVSRIKKEGALSCMSPAST